MTSFRTSQQQFPFAEHPPQDSRIELPERRLILPELCPVLSLWQPWGNRLLSGEKTLEVRTWDTKYRGLFAVAASARRDGTDGPFGCLLGLFELLGTRRGKPSDSKAAMCDVTSSHFVWEVRLVKPLPPIPVKGRLGFNLKMDLRSHYPEAPPTETP